MNRDTARNGGAHHEKSGIQRFHPAFLTPNNLDAKLKE